MLDIEGWLFRWFTDPVPYGHPQSDWRVDCFRCGDSKGHLHVSITKQAAHCFRCEYSANWVGLVMDATGLPYHQALGELYVIPNPRDFDRVGELLADESSDVQNYSLKERYELPEDFLPLEGSDGFVVGSVKRYLLGRGFGPDVWERYSLGYVPSVGPRVFIPIEGQYWQARALFPWQTPKYVGPKIPSENVLSNSVALQIYDEIVITEGVFSGIAVGPNHVSLVGKNVTPSKLSRLVAAPVTHYIVTVESGALAPMLELADHLRAYDKRVTIWQYMVGDPADSSPTVVEPYDFTTKLKLLLS